MKYVMTLVALVALFSTVQAEYNPNWWKSLELEPIATNDYVQAASVLRQQEGHVSFLYGADFSSSDVVAATNLWHMLAVLHGDVRVKRVLNPPPVFRNFGIITNQVELQRRIAANEDAKKIRNYESSRSSLEERIEHVLANAAASEALASFPSSARNATVSNLVEAARLTPAEAAALGLTNVVEVLAR